MRTPRGLAWGTLDMDVLFALVVNFFLWVKFLGL